MGPNSTAMRHLKSLDLFSRTQRWRRAVAAGVAAALVATLGLAGPASAAVPPEQFDPARGCTVVGTALGDVLKGTDGDDVICGGGGGDTIKAGAGNDVVYGDAGGDTIYGGSGDDIVYGGEGGDTIRGEDGADVVHGEGGGDTVLAGAGPDTVWGGDGADTLWGEDGPDSLFGEAGADTVRGGASDDVIADTGKADTLWGDDGDDRIIAGEGADSVRGNAGDDLLIGGPGNDSHYGDAGTDSCAGGTGPNAYYSCERKIAAGDLGGADGDLDGDGLPDGVELRAGSDPLARDTDADGIEDAAEFDTGTSPTSADTDGDGIPDPDDDVDGDGLTSAQELAAGSSGVKPDTDGDGLGDGEEVAAGLDPAVADSDGDGLRDGDEPKVGANPADADTDGDGVGDGEDVFTITLEMAEPPARLVATGLAAGLLETRLLASGDQRLEGLPGQRSPPVEVAAPDGVTGVLTVWFDTAGLTSADDVALLHYDTAADLLDVPAGQVVDLAGGAVTVEVDRFSPFVVVDVAEFAAIWNREFPSGPPVPGGRKPIDLVLVLDSSGSMSDNDPRRVRVGASEALIDALADADRVAVVDFDTRALILRFLTEDKAAAKQALSRIDASGGTNLTVGMGTALGLLSSPDPARTGAVVLLTDGAGAYDKALTQQAIDLGVTVYTVGLGRGTDEALLDGIASATGGKFFLADSAGDLTGIFREGIGGTLDDVDTDGDGLADTAESAGMLTSTGKILYSDPAREDTDGDGLTDGEEMGYLPSPGHAFGRGTAFQVLSNPALTDTDGDGLDDATEVANRFDAFDPDPDHDGLDDSEEWDWGTNDYSRDTDVDGWTDGEEAEMAAAGTGHDPTIYDEQVSRWQWTTDFIFGFYCGDLIGVFDDCGTYTVAAMAGAIVSGFLPLVADVRDMVGNWIKSDWVGVGFSAIGLVPLAGDLLKIGNRLVQLASGVGKLEGAARVTAIRNLGAHLDDPAKWSAKAVREVIEELNPGMMSRLGRITAKLGGDEAVLRFVSVGARHGFDPVHCEDVLQNARGVTVIPDGVLRKDGTVITQVGLESDGDAILRHVMTRVEERQRLLPLPAGVEGPRRRLDVIGSGLDDAMDWVNDSLDPDIIRATEGVMAIEDKTYAVRHTSRVNGQIATDRLIADAMARDAEYAADLRFDSIGYAFFAKETRRGACGPDEVLLQDLKDAKFPYYIFLGRP
jgi:hypothetical protein